ncbi:MAG: hypothetical protein ABIL02_06925 [candidate division WOR-3 bacterium]
MKYFNTNSKSEARNSKQIPISKFQCFKLFKVLEFGTWGLGFQPSIASFIFLLCIAVIGYASDARFAGMGNLEFILQDDLHKLNLYDFAGISAGLLKADPFASVMLRGSGLKEIWQKDFLTYFALGQAIPEKLAQYAPIEAVSFYEVIPQFPVVPCEFIYTSPQLKETYDEWGNLKPPQSWRVYGGYSQITRGYLGDTLSDRIKTPAFSGVFSSPISKSFDYGLGGDLFYAMYNSADNEDKGTLFPPGCGGGVVYNKPNLNLGLNIEYHYPMFEFKETWGEVTHSTKFSGHSASPVLGSAVNLNKIAWLTALDYKWLSLAGKYDTSHIGNIKMTGYTVKTIALVAPDFARLAVSGEYNSRSPAYFDDDGDTLFDMGYRNYIIGVGAGKEIKNFTIGLEGVYRYNFLNDRLQDSSIAGNDYVIKLGLEFGLIKDFFIRGGYNYNQIDPNLDQTEDGMTFNTITGGLGLKFIKNIRIDLAYNYKFGKLKSDPEERITDHIGYLYFRYNLPEREW